MPTPYVLTREDLDTDGDCGHITPDLPAPDLIRRTLPDLLGQQPYPGHAAFLLLTGSAITACALVSMPHPARLRHHLGPELGDDIAVTLPLLDAGPLWNPPPADPAGVIVVGYGDRDRDRDLHRIAELIPLPVPRLLRVHRIRWWRLDCPNPGSHTHPACSAFGAPLTPHPHPDRR